MKKTSKSNRQFELFNTSVENSINMPFSNDLKINVENLMRWRNNIYDYQKKIINGEGAKICQDSIFPNYNNHGNININPFLLQGLSLNFWRANQSVHNGPAMYFVIDTMKGCQIILYIGETNDANNRWRGNHDCKNYILNYKEALSFNKLTSHADIRFFLDVPKEVRLRRKLEKELIYLWLPPFNKETRGRWATTFTNN